MRMPQRKHRRLSSRKSSYRRGGAFNFKSPWQHSLKKASQKWLGRLGSRTNKQKYLFNHLLKTGKNTNGAYLHQFRPTQEDLSNLQKETHEISKQLQQYRALPRLEASRANSKAWVELNANMPKLLQRKRDIERLIGVKTQKVRAKK